MYKIVNSLYIEDLSEQVNSHLKSGWVLYDHLIVHKDYPDLVTTVFAQAMLKTGGNRMYEYKILSSYSMDDLSQQVSHLMVSKWHLRGGIKTYLGSEVSLSNNLAQVMVSGYGI